MLNKLNFSITVALSSLALILVGNKSPQAQTVLNQATVVSLQNQVRLNPDQPDGRNATVNDLLAVGDSIATARSSRVDLRFNDRSLARLGQQAFFRFRPNSRIADLTNGTGLFLINGGQGTTTIRTPNAAAGVRGSALFIRVIPAKDGQEGKTLIGALTDSGIQACNQDASQCVDLKPGQMANFEGENLTNVYQFDLVTLLNTSPLTQDLDQVAPESVLTEIQQALESVPSLDQNSPILTNPDFVAMPDQTETEFPNGDLEVVDLNFESKNGNQETLQNATSLDVQEMTQIGEIRLNTPFEEIFPGGGATGGVFPGGGATGGIFPGGGNNGNNGVRDLGAGQGRDGVGNGTGTGLQNKTQ